MATVQLVRHATLRVTVDGTTFLLDPMLDPPGARPPVPNTPNDRENPLTALPDVDLSHDAVVVTHRHEDHLDDAARERLAADVPLFCQPAEADAFREEGFEDVRPVEDATTFREVDLARTPARHGHGDLAERMGPVSGFVFGGDRTVYVAGDTVWYDAVADALDVHDPDVAVVNAGAAQFVEGDPITMDADDVAAAVDRADCPVAAVHMDAINHCLLTRAELRVAVPEAVVPENGAALDV